jgi:hypothetical protein
MKCIAALSEHEAEELGYEILNETRDEFVEQLHAGAGVYREVYGGNTLFAEVAEEYRRQREECFGDDIDEDFPHFDDPDFLTKLHTDGAPLVDRKRLFVRLWNGFELEDKRAFLSRVDPNGVFRQVSA